ncbi:MAG: hypothetical protein ACI7YS_11790 [Flavobacterium sp.]
MTQTNNEEGTQFVPQYIPGPQALIYKTKNDYSNLVPILLSADKTEIISYPHPNDLKVGSGYPLPTFLNDGYLLDNRGIGKNVAFLKLTYQEYSELKNPPSLTELYSYIIDKDPLTELCDCGNKTAFTDIKKQLNILIDKKKLRTTCKPIK